MRRFLTAEYAKEMHAEDHREIAKLNLAVGKVAECNYSFIITHSSFLIVPCQSRLMIGLTSRIANPFITNGHV